jgi:methionine synthase II (cobalamin-independent)
MFFMLRVHLQPENESVRLSNRQVRRQICRGGPNERPSPEGSREKDLELFETFQNDLKKKVAIGGREHRTLQADRPEDSVAEIRHALKFIPPERLRIRTFAIDVTGFRKRQDLSRAS